MQIGKALERGIYFGAQLGAVVAILGLLISGGVGFNILGSFFESSWGAAGSIAAVTGEVLAGIGVGATLGGFTFASTQAVFGTFSGLGSSLGVAPMPETAASPSRGNDVNITVLNDKELETGENLEYGNDQSTNFRRYVEEDRQRAEMMDEIAR